MCMRTRWMCSCVAWMLAGIVPLAGAGEVTVLHGDTTITIEETLADPTDLWVSPADLTRINGFVLKPEGACLDDICIPVRQDEDSPLVITRDGKKWVNVSELARRIQQAFVFDADTAVWSFGEIPATRRSFLGQGMAPDFALTDRQGKTVRLSDFRGKKVLIITWASW